jgi:hypothetical protein
MRTLIIFVFTVFYCGGQINGVRWAYSTIGSGDKCVYKGNRRFAWSRYGWEDDSETILREVRIGIRSLVIDPVLCSSELDNEPSGLVNHRWFLK